MKLQALLSALTTMIDFPEPLIMVFHAFWQMLTTKQMVRRASTPELTSQLIACVRLGSFC
jgi:hypothetical protein